MIKYNKNYEPMITVLSDMAKSNNLPAKKYKAGERTELNLRFVWNAGSGSPNVIYIDLAKALSQVNRRFYRQGLYYYVQSVAFNNGSNAQCSISTVPDTWQTKLAWKRGFQLWSKMNRKAMPDGMNITPKYHDYKIKMDSTDDSGGTLNAYWGELNSPSEYFSDDWVLSTYVTEDPDNSDPNNQARDDFIAHMIGPHVGAAQTGGNTGYASVGLIRSLNDVWLTNDDSGEPNVDGLADTDPLANLFDDSDNQDDIRSNLDTHNDETPYDNNVMTGAISAEEHVQRAIIRVGSGAGSLGRANGFCAPFGLLRVETTDWGEIGNDLNQVMLHITMVPGSYHGVYAERVI